MQIGKDIHLTYCSNIHPGETWEEIFNSLQAYVIPLKERLSPSQKMGVGLRLSNQASLTLIKPEVAALFKSWLLEKGLYVFTMNGFPYGNFHRQVVKDHVYEPDWTTTERLDYTIRLSQILADLLPEGMEGGISTSPVSYKPWYSQNPVAMADAFKMGGLHLAKVVEALLAIREKTGKVIHIDIEPEPDCTIENTEELIYFFEKYLLPIGANYLTEQADLSHADAEQAIHTHIQACYDVCHFAVEYEKPAEVFERLAQAGISIGKIQISAALKALLPEDPIMRRQIAQRFQNLAESTYLHQVIVRNKDNSFTHYPDLPQALPFVNDSQAAEWRTHFHVPVFVSDYENLLQSTQGDIIEVLRLQKLKPVTQHLEVETYTWEVLPETIKTDLLSSIGRELEWVMQQIKL